MISILTKIIISVMTTALQSRLSSYQNKNNKNLLVLKETFRIKQIIYPCENNVFYIRLISPSI